MAEEGPLRHWISRFPIRKEARRLVIPINLSSRFARRGELWRIRLLGFLLILLPLGPELLAEPEEGAPQELTPKLIEQLDYHAQRCVEEMKKALPVGYSLQPRLTQRWSDGQGKVVPILLSLTPIDPGGKPDGEAKFLEGHSIGRTVPYVKGIKQGVEKKYQANSGAGAQGPVIVAEIPWKEGKIHGIKKLYHLNGKVRVETPFENGAVEGESKEYDLAGRLVKVTSHKQGKRHGEMTEYWVLTGKPLRVVPYQNDHIHGLVREYFDGGQLKKEVKVKDDRLHGEERNYDEDGNLVKRRYWFEDEEVPKEEFEKRAK